MPRKARTIILTASVAAITATGAWYGAGLKTQQEYHQEKQSIQAFPLSEKISSLEATKQKLQSQREDLRIKIDQLNSSNSGTGSTEQQVKPAAPEKTGR